MSQADQSQTTPSSSSPAAGQQQASGSGAGSSAGSQATQTQQNQQTQQDNGQPAAAGAAPSRPTEFADARFDNYWDATGNRVKYDALAKDITDLTAFKAEQDAKRLSLPQKPEDYKLDLPKTFKVPDGIKFDGIDANDPRLAEARKFAVAHGLSQEGFSEILAIQAMHQIGEIQQIETARKGEIDKLGANGPARVDAVATWLTARLGSEAGGALLQRLVLASDLEAMEALVKQFSSQGATSFNGSHRSGGNGQISDEAYEKMSPREKLDYARQARTAAGR